MKENSRLRSYKDPEKQVEWIKEYNSKNYRNFTFRLHKIRDKEIIDAIDNRKASLPELIKNWYKKKN